jgi:hypothetical protein
MFSHEDPSVNAIPGLRLRMGTIASLLCLSLAATGCITTEHQHAVVLAAATAPVIDQAAAAYRDAEKAYELGSDLDAATAFDATDTVYNPRAKKVLLTEQQIEARLKVLAAFQLYVKDVVAITNGTDSPDLDAASQSLGSDLSSVANTLGPSIASALGIAQAGGSATASSSPTPLVSTGVQNGLSTGIDALGQFLVNRTIQKNLPQKIEAMDPVLEQLCKVLADDVSILRGEEHRTYDRIINQQTLFLRENKDKIDPDLRRREIMKLPALAREQSAADERLDNLEAAITKLALTHHALAADAQGNNPESLKQRLGELQAAGESLGKFYSSL